MSSENLEVITCTDSGENTVLLIKPSENEKSEIVQVMDNCYELRYANCDTIKVTEKFELEFLAQHMKSIQ